MNLLDITSSNLHWYRAIVSLINFHLSRHRVITTMQPHQQHHLFFAGLTFKLGIFSDDPSEPPHTTLQLPRLRPTRLEPVSFHGKFKDGPFASASLVLSEPCLNHIDQAFPVLSCRRQSRSVIGRFISHETPQAAICRIRLAFWNYLDGQCVAYRELTAIA